MAIWQKITRPFIMGLLALALLFTLSGCGWVFDLLAPTVNDESKEEIAEWFDTDWQYRKQLNISNPTGGTQMKLVVYQKDGHDNIAAGIMDCEGKCASDFSDLRFVGADDSTLCDYWIERQTADYAVVWIKSQGEDHLFVYYGNGYEFEAREVAECVRAGRTESPIMTLDETVRIMRTLDTIRDQAGLVYPFET